MNITRSKPVGNLHKSDPISQFLEPQSLLEVLKESDIDTHEIPHVDMHVTTNQYITVNKIYVKDYSEGLYVSQPLQPQKEPDEISDETIILAAERELKRLSSELLELNDLIRASLTRMDEMEAQHGS